MGLWRYNQSMSETDTLSKAEIIRYFSDLAINKVEAISLYDSVYSTQDMARQSRVPANQLHVTNYQTNGRGRNAKDWLSISGAQVLMSFTWCYQKLPQPLSVLGLILAVEVAKTIKLETNVDVLVKWPNDIYWVDRKLAGLLVDVETSLESRIIIGLGLNVSLPEDICEELGVACLSNAFALPANSSGRSDCGRIGDGTSNSIVCRNKLISVIVSRWCDALTQFATIGFSPWKKQFNQMAKYKGELIILTHQTSMEPIIGVFEGVDDQGCLLIVMKNGKRKTISDSRWSLRPYDD